MSNFSFSELASIWSWVYSIQFFISDLSSILVGVDFEIELRVSLRPESIKTPYDKSFTIDIRYSDSKKIEQ